MTQDQYGQARDSGYVVSGQVVEDEQADEYDDGQDKKMTTFQKVASALRGDRLDRDAPDQDVPENASTTGQTPARPDDLTVPDGTATDPNGAAVGPDGLATGQTSQDSLAPGTPGTGRPDTVAPGAGTVGTQDTFAGDPGAQGTTGQDAGAFGQDPKAAAGAGAGAERGDYWDVPDTRGTAADQEGTVTYPDQAPVDTGGDALSRQDAPGATVTQPGAFDAGAAAPVATDTPAQVTAPATDTAAPVAADADAGYPSDAVDTGAGTAEVSPQGAATIPDVPVTQTPEEAAAGAGRHAAPGQELHPGEGGTHPGEGAGSLDDLGDLAYGKLIPDAGDFTAQWQEIQLKFVDDPHASVTEAAAIIEQVTTKMEAAIAERQRAIAERQQAIAEQQRSLRGRWGEGTQADTETLRATLRMYKAFLDQLVGPKV